MMHSTAEGAALLGKNRSRFSACLLSSESTRISMEMQVYRNVQLQLSADSCPWLNRFSFLFSADLVFRAVFIQSRTEQEVG